MSVNVKESISIRKKDLVHSKLNRITGAKTVRFYHKATAGQVTIDLNNLSFPSAELPSTSNPSPGEIAQMRLSLTKKNFRLFSLLEGELIQHDSFQIRDNYTIELTGGMSGGAQADEIFMGELYNAPIDNTVVTDSKNLWRTYDLVDTQSSVSLGESFQITNLSYQVGEILVIRNGTNLYRCVGNVITGEGDYIEIDAGDGSSSSIQLKTPASGDAESLIVYFGLQFSGDIALWGQIESMTAAIHALAQDAAQGFYGDSDVDRYLSQNPAEADRRTFGDTVLQNQIDISNKEDKFDIEWQSKALSTTNGGSVTFNNLEIDKTYRISGSMSFSDSGAAADVPTASLVASGAFIKNYNTFVASGTSPIRSGPIITMSDLFIATATTLTITTNFLNITSAQSADVMLEELPKHKVTSKWT